MNRYYGYATTKDERQVRLSENYAKRIWDEVEADKQRRKDQYPDTQSVLSAMMDTSQRLTDLGWSECIYCPKDGTEFAVLSQGSTGIFSAMYCGEWPKGHLLLGDYLSQPEGYWWKPIDKLTEWEAAQLKKCDEAERQAFEAHMDRMSLMGDGVDDARV